jgi:signal transduction histidine kinase
MNLSAAVSKSLSIHIPLAQEKNLTVETGQLDDVFVHGNVEAVAILSSTIIDNAVKYTDRAGRVRIEVFSSSVAELRIEDSGPGIPEEDRNRVFDRFYRRRDALGGGSGLGLAIAKEIATRCNATIVLGSSEDLGGLKVSVFFTRAFDPPGESQSNNALLDNPHFEDAEVTL